MKILTLFLASLCVAVQTYAERPPVNPSAFSSVTDIDDLALIYIGAQHRPTWDKNNFRPYVSHTFPDGSQSWMFDGFLMLDFMRWNKDCKAVNLGEYIGATSLQEDWSDMLDEQLGTKTGNGCRALDELIGELIPILGRPAHKHKVVMCIPTNWVKGDWVWGTVDGKEITGNDRETAGKWYIDELLRRWNAAGFKNIELDGIYWTKESFHEDLDDHVRTINNYSRDNDLLVYWIPYVSAKGRGEWRDWGVDVAYLQPNYYFKEERPMSQLDGAIEFAKAHGMGMEIEFAGYDFSWNCTTGERKKFAPANIGLYDIHPNYYKRLVDYVDHYEEQEIFSTRPMAYYSGFQGFYDFTNSGNDKDREIMDRFATILNRRHQISGWVKDACTQNQ